MESVGQKDSGAEKYSISFSMISEVTTAGSEDGCSLGDESALETGPAMRQHPVETSKRDTISKNAVFSCLSPHDACT